MSRHHPSCCVRSFTVFVALLAALIAPRLLAGTGTPVGVLVTSPLLGKFVQELAGDAVRTYPLWCADGPPERAEVDETISLPEKNMILFLAYGVEPFTNIENTAARMLPRDSRMVRIQSEGVHGQPVSTGEMVLDPLWAFNAAGVIGAELVRALPDREKGITESVREFRAKVVRLTYGDKYATEMEEKGLLDAGSEVRFREWAAGLIPTADIDCLAGKLTGYTGVKVADDWGLLGAFCTRFGLKHSAMPPSVGGQADVPQQLLVNWTAKDREALTEDWRIMRLSVAQSALRGDSGSVAETIAALMAAIEPCVVSCKVRELLRADVDTKAALALDGRAVDELVDTLNHTDRSAYWRGAVWLLGYVGDSRGYQPLADLVTQRFAYGQVTVGIEKAILSVPKAMGLLAARGNASALHFLEGSCSPEFWKDKVTWRGGSLQRDTVIISLTENAIMGVGISGQRDATWLSDFIRTRDSVLADSWAAFIETDMFLWWHEKYGMRLFLQEWRTPLGALRQNEYWKSARAARMKETVTPPGIRLPDELPQ